MGIPGVTGWCLLPAMHWKRTLHFRPFLLGMNSPPTAPCPWKGSDMGEEDPLDCECGRDRGTVVAPF